jgi:hypothetical protein
MVFSVRWGSGRLLRRSLLVNQSEPDGRASVRLRDGTRQGSPQPRRDRDHPTRFELWYFQPAGVAEGCYAAKIPSSWWTTSTHSKSSQSSILISGFDFDFERAIDIVKSLIEVTR